MFLDVMQKASENLHLESFDLAVDLQMVRCRGRVLDSQEGV